MMSCDYEPFGGCDLLEPEPGTSRFQPQIHATKEDPHDERYECEPGPSNERDDEPRSSRSPVSAPVFTPAVQPTGRLLKNTQLYREPNGLSKTVTYPIEDIDPSPKPTIQPSGRNLTRGDGSRKLQRLNLQIGGKYFSFKVKDVPPEDQILSDWNSASPTVAVMRPAAPTYVSRLQCRDCSRIFPTMEDRRRHVLLQECALPRPFACTYCNKHFANRGDFELHMKGHNNGRHLTCHLCNKTFKYQSNLNQHLKLHMSGVRHFCNMCGKCCKSSDELAHHHTVCMSASEGGFVNADRPLRYNCDYCNKPFHHRRDKAIHERIHTGIRPYECGYCLRGFTQSQALTSHIRLHTGERPYPCSMCGKYFRDSSALRKHETNHLAERAASMDEMNMRMQEEEEEEEVIMDWHQHSPSMGDLMEEEEIVEELSEDADLVYEEYSIGEELQ